MEKDKINLTEIKKLIPHREPFLYIEELENIEKLKKATGIKNFTNEENFFDGHFPGHPVVPGVILIEMLAQTAAALIAFSIRNETFDKIVYLMNVEKARFRNPVLPDCRRELYIEAVRSHGRVWKYKGEASVNNKKMADAVWSATIVDRK